MPPRAEQFQSALRELRERLRNGVWLPGARITATELAAELQFSATPVREALSRLAGEGLIEDRRGQGFFVRGLGAADIADLWRLRLECLRIAREPGRSGQAAESAAGRDPIAIAEALLAGLVAQAGGRVLARFHGRVALQLGPARRQEVHLFKDLDVEAASLSAAIGTDTEAAALERFHLRRAGAAEPLAALLQGSVRNGEI